MLSEFEDTHSVSYFAVITERHAACLSDCHSHDGTCGRWLRSWELGHLHGLIIYSKNITILNDHIKTNDPAVNIKGNLFEQSLCKSVFVHPCVYMKKKKKQDQVT